MATGTEHWLRECSPERECGALPHKLGRDPHFAAPAGAPGRRRAGSHTRDRETTTRRTKVPLQLPPASKSMLHIIS